MLRNLESFGGGRLRTPTGYLILGIAFAAAALAVAPVQACSVPVFQYAVMSWPAEPYEVLLFHRGPLGPDDSALLEWLNARADYMDVCSNISVTAVDLDASPDEEYLLVWKGQNDAQLPRVVLRYPESHHSRKAVWSGPLTAVNAQRLVDSPARRQIGKRILTGEAAVFLLLESGDSKSDDRAAKLIKREIGKLKKQLKLPEPFEGEDVQYVPDVPDVPEQPIDFSLLRVSRTDEKEAVLVDMLLGMELDLRASRKPMMFSVIGRGRALPPLVGSGINALNLRMVGEFVTGPCSCDVKAMNPGIDLLVSLDWEGPAEGQWTNVQPPPGLPEAPHPDQPSPAAAAKDTQLKFLVVGAGIVLGALVIAAMTGIILRQRKQGT